jgi:CRISPR system Cascade subunit CasA
MKPVSNSTADPAGGTDTAHCAAFDLYAEPWIPVVRGGAEELVSLREAVTDAHQLDGLSTTDGPKFAGLLRLLIALVMDVYGQPTNDREWASRRSQGCFDAEALDDYVDQVGRNRFDLFDAEHPFMQSATTPDEGKSVAELLPHVASGNRTPLWTPDTDSTPRALTFDRAAQALVAAQCVAVSLSGLGAPSKEDAGTSWAGVDFFGRAGVIGFCCPLGDTLFETLMMNLVNGSHTRRDSSDPPVWRREDVPPSRSKRFSRGMADLLTWTPRRVRLIPDGNTVSRVCFRGGDALPELNFDHEPHTALIQSDGKGKGNPLPGQWFARKHLRNTFGWRGIPQLLALGRYKAGSQPPIAIQHLGNRLEFLPQDYRVTVLSMYVEYGNKSAVIDNISTDVVPFPVRAFGESETDIRDMLVDLVDTADLVLFLVRGYAADVYAVTHRDLDKPNPKAKSPREKRGRKASWAFADAVAAELSSQIDAITRRLLSDLATNPSDMDQLRESWSRRLKELADVAVGRIEIDCGPEVFSLIAEVRTTGSRDITVKPPAVRRGELRTKLGEILGTNQEEVTA